MLQCGIGRRKSKDFRNWKINVNKSKSKSIDEMPWSPEFKDTR